MGDGMWASLAGGGAVSWDDCTAWRGGCQGRGGLGVSHMTHWYPAHQCPNLAQWAALSLVGGGGVMASMVWSSLAWSVKKSPMINLWITDVSAGQDHFRASLVVIMGDFLDSSLGSSL